MSAKGGTKHEPHRRPTVRDYRTWLEKRLEEPRELVAFLSAHAEFDPEDGLFEHNEMLTEAVRTAIRVLKNKHGIQL